MPHAEDEGGRVLSVNTPVSPEQVVRHAANRRRRKSLTERMGLCASRAMIIDDAASSAQLGLPIHGSSSHKLVSTPQDSLGR